MSFRVVQNSFWDDEKVVDFSPEDKYFFLYILTSPSSNALGVYKLTMKKISSDMGYSQEAVKVLINRFIDHDIIAYNFETQEIAIGNYLFHSIVKGGKPMMDAIEKDIEKVTDISLMAYVIKKMQHKRINADKKKALVEIISYINDYLIKNNIYVYDDSCTDSWYDSVFSPKKSERLKLDEENFNKILAIYPKKTGIVSAFERYRDWVSDEGRKVGKSKSRKVKLTNKQIWLAVKKYVEQKEESNSSLEYYKGFDVLMGDSLLDYVDLDK